MDRTQVTFSDGPRQESISRSAFRARWDGNYLLIWPTPKGVRPMLRQGMRGQDVAWLRNTLTRNGRPLPAEHDAQPPSGDIFDGDLVRLVRAFQRTHALPVDGVAGPQTIACLHSILGWSDAPVLHSPVHDAAQARASIADAQ